MSDPKSKFDLHSKTPNKEVQSSCTDKKIIDDEQASDSCQEDEHCPSSSLIENWHPFNSTTNDDDSGTISTRHSLDSELHNMFERHDFAQLKAILQKQRAMYKSRLLVEKAKRKALERLIVEDDASQKSSVQNSSSSIGGKSSSGSGDPLNEYLLEMVKRQARKSSSSQSTIGDNAKRLSKDKFCNCSDNLYYSASSDLPMSDENLRQNYGYRSAPCSAGRTSDRLWFLPLRPSSAPTVPLQECLKLKRPNVWHSIERRQERLRLSNDYRKALSAKIRQLAEHAALGLISEREAEMAMGHLPRPDLFINFDIVRETKRRHRHLPERREKIAQYRKQLELATNRLLSKMVAQRIQYDRRRCWASSTSACANAGRESDLAKRQ